MWADQYFLFDYRVVVNFNCHKRGAGKAGARSLVCFSSFFSDEPSLRYLAISGTLCNPGSLIMSFVE